MEDMEMEVESLVDEAKEEEEMEEMEDEAVEECIPLRWSSDDGGGERDGGWRSNLNCRSPRWRRKSGIPTAQGAFRLGCLRTSSRASLNPSLESRKECETEILWSSGWYRTPASESTLQCMSSEPLRMCENFRSAVQDPGITPPSPSPSFPFPSFSFPFPSFRRCRRRRRRRKRSR